MKNKDRKQEEKMLRDYQDNLILRLEKRRPITLQELSWQENFIQRQLNNK
ncbi:hypothetical protein [Lactococcus lactis]|jgi:hypothetical protein|uniref:Uncharacterized protein n=3 Tax=Lactococcus lactis TaxID=1358 RepID=A0A0V8ELU4_LACLL|nr:hypothetical protein [Lactococcus lactis]KSU06172.1 hypothetical protein LMG8520_2166 [Lactococcus lactis subsp. lactis]KSU26851.1 hypothetical protein N42_1386 [Lactococcus lactis subsp. lactis]MCQ4972460.1 hypothetical protein [Lactococcus lactis]MCQ4998266.1 hypothetical protein [Lactococcus lactis]MDG4959939.1 hypothetical protein [Lactococcus lactis]